MQLKDRLLRLLQVRENEWWLVRQLFFQQFFSGAGIAFYFTAVFALFLQKFAITEFPKMLIASAFMLWITGFVFTKVEHKVNVKNLILVLNIFIAASILIFRMAAFYTDSIWFYFAMLVWYNVLYLLNSLDFWGLASLLFDVRQSKRLFGIISAGDIPAKFIGYSSASILAQLIGPLNLLIVASVAVLYSLVYWHRLKKSGHLNLHVDHHVLHEFKEHKKKFTENIIHFFENKLVFHLAVLSFIMVSIATCVSFAFYAKVKSTSLNDVLLASYIGFFLATSRGIAMVMKIFFTNRITNALGIKFSLLISPVILLLLLIPVLLTPLFNEGTQMVLIIFGLLSATNDVLRSSIQIPVFLSVMQPLHAAVRLRAHNIIKGIMDPFAFFFIGLFLYFMINAGQKVDLLLLSYVLLALLVLCIVWIYIIDKEYVKMLVIALRNRYFNGKEINFKDKETFDFFVRKSIDGEETEVIFILNLIRKNYSRQSEEIILNALHHPSDHVKIEAIKTIERVEMKSNIDEMNLIANAATNQLLLCEAVKAIYTLTDDADYSAYLSATNSELMSSAITGMLNNQKLKKKGHTFLKEFIVSNRRENRIYASAIIAATRDAAHADDLIRLINDSDFGVSKSAMEASGKVHHPKLVTELLKQFEYSRKVNTVLGALLETGSRALLKINDYLNSHPLEKTKTIQLINLFGKIGGAEARELLDEIIIHKMEFMPEIIHALYSADFKVKEHNQKRYAGLLNKLLETVARMVMQIQILSGDSKHNLLLRALQLELNSYRSVILNVFTFFYETEKIQRARNIFYLDKKDSIANALEIIDVTVAKEFAQKFIAVYDTIDGNHKSMSVKKFITNHPVSLEDVLDVVLADTASTYNDWTKACALYELKNQGAQKYRDSIIVLAGDENLLLSETANYVLES